MIATAREPSGRTTGSSAVVAAAFLALVFVHAVLGMRMNLPHIFGDELGYLGHARYFAGAGRLPDFGIISFYHFGYSLLLVPAFVLFREPTVVYHAAILTNAVVMSTLFLCLYYTLRGPFGVERRLSVAVAFVTSLYPAYILQSNFAWAENALIPGYAAFVAAFAALTWRYSVAKALLLGVLTAALYAVHPRALPLLPMTASALGVLALRRILPWTGTLACIAVIAAGYVAIDVVNDHLRTLGWAPERQATTAVAFLGRAGTPQRFVNLIFGSFGQFLYLVQATHGLFLVGPIWLLDAVRRDGAARVLARYDRRVLLAGGFILACAGVLFAVSGISMAGGGKRSDHLMYGRYNEVFLPHFLAFGLLALPEVYRRLGKWLPLIVLGVFGALTLIVTLARGELLASRDFVAPNIFGIYAVVRALGRVDPVLTSLVSAGLFLSIFAAFRRGITAGLVAVTLPFTLAALYGYGYCTDAQASLIHADDVPGRVRALGDVAAVSYDMHLPREDPSPRYYRTQFLLPRTRVERFNSRRGEQPGAPVVIASRTWGDAERLRARFVTSEERSDQALWVLPSSQYYRSATPSYVGVALGWRWFPGVFESGFYGRRGGGRGAFRWTNGNARLLVPVNEPPRRLVVTLRPVRPGLRVQILVNRTEVFNGPYPGGTRTFSLEGFPMGDWVTIGIVSDTVVPSERVPRSNDRRALGVAVHEVRLGSE